MSVLTASSTLAASFPIATTRLGLRRANSKRNNSSPAGKHEVRELDTDQQMQEVILLMVGKRLKNDELVQDNGLTSGAYA